MNFKHDKADLGCIFYDIELKFFEINIKIVSKKQLINKSYELEVEKIKNRYQQNVINDLYAYNLFNQKDVLLSQLYHDRNNHIGNLIAFYNKAFEDLILIYIFDVHNFEFRFKDLINSIRGKFFELKSNFLYFNRAKLLDFNLILNPYKFRKPLDFLKLNKYSHLLAAKKNFRIPEPYGINIEDVDIKNNCFLLPSTNKLLIVVKQEDFHFTMLIISHKCKVLQFRKFFSYGNHRIHVTKSKIVLIHPSADTSLNANQKLFSNIEIFNSQLDLTHKINLNITSMCKITIANDNEALFHKIGTLSFILCNWSTLKSTNIQLQNANKHDQFYAYGIEDEMIHLNDKNIYMARLNPKTTKFEAIYIIDRLNGNRVSNISIRPRHQIQTIKFDDESQVYDIDSYVRAKIINVYDMNGKFMYKIPLKEEFMSMRFNSFDTMTYNEVINEKFVNFCIY